MSNPNIMTKRQRTKQAHRAMCKFAEAVNARSGDVRRCQHGRLQMVDHPRAASLRLWYDLDFIDAPILWWRARRALARAGRSA